MVAAGRVAKPAQQHCNRSTPQVPSEFPLQCKEDQFFTSSCYRGCIIQKLLRTFTTFTSENNYDIFTGGGVYGDAAR